MMPPIKHPLLILATILIAGGLTVQWVQPVSACIELQGNAAWFYRSCSAQPGSAATWQVGPDPSKPGRKALLFQIENAYPGYKLECDLYFANGGDLPFTVQSLRVTNFNPQNMTITAVETPHKNTISPCNIPPAWGRNPSLVATACRSKIHVSLTIGQNVDEDASLPFGVQVGLRQK